MPLSYHRSGRTHILNTCYYRLLRTHRLQSRKPLKSGRQLLGFVCLIQRAWLILKCWGFTSWVLVTAFTKTLCLLCSCLFHGFLSGVAFRLRWRLRLRLHGFFLPFIFDCLPWVVFHPLLHQSLPFILLLHCWLRLLFA